ncbi:hypothetical protein [Streptomyces chattanoogensis]|uniref:hypothetical protein n=1 Tax=Streptomyces chattanoogensis TaxID=66876 RepID=UPI0012FED193|nr:hypothetical protein [Streptomyces chattanoogensis]
MTASGKGDTAPPLRAPIGMAGRQDVYGAGEAIQAASGVSRAYQAVPKDGDQERGQPD